MVQDSGNDSPKRQSLSVVPTVLAALVILAGAGLLYRFVINPRAPISIAGTEREGGGSQDWPSPPPTFTPMPSLVPVLLRTSAPTPTSTPTPTPTPLPPPSWEELGYLTSIEFTSTAIVEKERDKSVVRGVLGADRVLMMAVGEVQAGVDLTEVKSSDFEIDGSSLRLTLPHATVTSVELLPGESRIYDSRHSWAFSEYEGLEKEALEEARRQLRQNIQSSESMMSLAETLARLQLTDFLRKAGFTEIEIVFKAERH